MKQLFKSISKAFQIYFSSLSLPFSLSLSLSLFPLLSLLSLSIFSPALPLSPLPSPPLPLSPYPSLPLSPYPSLAPSPARPPARPPAVDFCHSTGHHLRFQKDVHRANITGPRRAAGTSVADRAKGAKHKWHIICISRLQGSVPSGCTSAVYPLYSPVYRTSAGSCTTKPVVCTAAGIAVISRTYTRTPLQSLLSLALVNKLHCMTADDAPDAYARPCIRLLPHVSAPPSGAAATRVSNPH